MTATLTERYIAATVKNLPAASEADVRAELDALISDSIDARVDNGEGRADAERAVLTELGDPGILAAGFADRPLHLIGPKYYLTWWRLLKLLLIIVPACVLGAVVLAKLIEGAPIGEVIGGSIGIALSVAVHVAFWVTLVFAVLERSGADTGVRWDVDQLPEPQTNGSARADLIGALVFLAIAAGVLLWDQFRGLVHLDGMTFSVVHPELWPWAFASMLLLIAAEAILMIVIYRVGRWTVSAAIANTVLAMLFASLVGTLFVNGQLINPELVSLVFTDNGVDANTMHILAIITGFAIFGFAAWDAIDGWVKTVKARTAGG